MGKSKPEKPADFAERGISRVRSETLDRSSIAAIHDAVSKLSPFKLSKQASSTIDNVSMIYELRGFQRCSKNDMIYVVSDSWKLSWLDKKEDGNWISASFAVDTNVGLWRVNVTHKGIVDAAFPLVDGESQSGPTKNRQVTHTSDEGNVSVRGWSPEEKREEEQRLKTLGQALCNFQHQLQSFVDGKCPQSGQPKITKESEKLQEQCKDDMPLLSAAVEWTNGESWKAWAKRLLQQVNDACEVHCCCVPVKDVCFTHDSISTRFMHGEAAGKELETLVEDLRWCRVDPLKHDELVIDAVRYAGKLHSLNNRRLWALQQHQLLLMEKGNEVKARLRVLPWTQAATVKRFLSAFTSVTGGETVTTRTELAGSPPAAVVATTLGRAVLATTASVKAERQKQKSTSCQVAAESPAKKALAVEDKEPLETHTLSLGHQSFTDWRAAKEYVQTIMRKYSSGKPLPEKEFRLVMDVFQYHPDPKGKRLSEVTQVTVGSSQKFANTPSFWIWRADGSGDDISAKKCWDKLDLIEKGAKKREKQREVIAGGQRFCGVLDGWFRDTSKNYGFLKLEASEPVQLGDVRLMPGQKLYLEWSDVAAQSQAWANASHGSRAKDPFPKGQRFSFAVYRWLENMKLGCLDARHLS